MPILEATQPLPITFSPLLRHYTLEEFWALTEPTDRSRYELIEGTLFMTPPPDPSHGSIDARLANALHRFLITQNIVGEVHHPREPIYINGTYLEPDMMYVSHELRARMGARRTSADIVFEYLSKSTATYDRTTKADTYLALGVRELWLVDPDAVSIEVRHAHAASSHAASSHAASSHAASGGNELPRWESCVSTAGQWAESRVLPGWRVAVDMVFAGLV